MGSEFGVRRLVLWVAILSQLMLSCHAQTPTTVTQDAPLLTGAEVLLYDMGGGDTITRVAVVANHTSLVPRLDDISHEIGYTHLVDTMLALGNRVVKIFCPEHGFRGTAAAGAKVDNSVDPTTGLPIISLYGKNKKPTPEQLKDIDVVLFDLQDVGCRFYTYISTLHYVMEACAEANIPLWVLDRPNPNGHYIDGPVLDTATCRSFVGMHPVPIVYGMTIGEYAQMINGEGWLKGGEKCNLTVVPMQGYKRDSVGYELPVPPSPNLRNAHAIALYPSLCLFEGTNVSVGRGTDSPFEVIGVPSKLCRWIDFNTRYTINGQTFYAYDFKTQDGESHYGLDLREMVVPAKFDLSYLIWMHWLTKSGFFFLKSNFFEKLAGTPLLRYQISTGMPEEQIRKGWQPELDHFKEVRKKYLIYPDFVQPHGSD